jgi:hypothetical protein
MPSIQEKLKGLYDKPRVEAHSWIPKKVAGTPLEILRKTLQPEKSISPKRAFDLLSEQELLSEAKMNVFELVAEYFLTERREEDIEENLANFQGSWDELFERHGPVMVLALNELVEEMKFVGPEGRIRKSVLNKMIRKIEKNQ